MIPLDIIQRVSDARGVGVKTVRFSGLRYKAIAKARHEAQWLIRETRKLSYPDIGALFGDMDHTTVLSAVRKIGRQVAVCPAYGVELLAIIGVGSTAIAASELDVLRGEAAALRCLLDRIEQRLDAALAVQHAVESAVAA